jgi:hypothetical protein
VLSVHRNFDPGTIPAGSARVDLNGREGRVVTSTQKKPFIPAPRGYLGPIQGEPLQTVVWQPAGGLWALLTCSSQLELGTREVPQLDAPYQANAALAVTIAKSVSPGTRNLGSPVKVGYLPEGMRAGRLIYRQGESFTIDISDGDPATGYQPRELKGYAETDRPYDPRPGDDLRIRYAADESWDLMSRIPTGKPDLVINGMKGWYVHDQYLASKGEEPVDSVLRMEGDGVAILVEDLGRTPDLDELRKVAESLQRTANPADPDTWFDAATSIP